MHLIEIHSQEEHLFILALFGKGHTNWFFEQETMYCFLPCEDVVFLARALKDYGLFLFSLFDGQIKLRDKVCNGEQLTDWRQQFPPLCILTLDGQVCYMMCTLWKTDYWGPCYSVVHVHM